MNTNPSDLSITSSNLVIFLTRAVGKTGQIESDTAPSIITVTSADESDVDITEAVEKTTGAKHQLNPLNSHSRKIPNFIL